MANVDKLNNKFFVEEFIFALPLCGSRTLPVTNILRRILPHRGGSNDEERPGLSVVAGQAQCLIVRIFQWGIFRGAQSIGNVRSYFLSAVTEGEGPQSIPGLSCRAPYHLR